MEELLDNCASSLVNSCRSPEEIERKPIRVTVCTDDDHVVIRIIDEGGGLSVKNEDGIWSFLYSTKSGDESHSPTALVKQASPLSGRGMGLPLSRIYMTYLGGRMEFMN